MIPKPRQRAATDDELGRPSCSAAWILEARWRCLPSIARAPEVLAFALCFRFLRPGAPCGPPRLSPIHHALALRSSNRLTMPACCSRASRRTAPASAGGSERQDASVSIRALFGLCRIRPAIHRAHRRHRSRSHGPMQRRHPERSSGIGIRTHRDEVLDRLGLRARIPPVRIGRVMERLRSSAILRSSDRLRCSYQEGGDVTSGMPPRPYEEPVSPA